VRDQFSHPNKTADKVKADSHIACRSHAGPMPCRALIHTWHDAPLPCSDSAVSFVKVRVVAGNIRTASPTVVFFVMCCYHSFPRPWQTLFGFKLATCIWDWYAADNNFVELCVVAGRSRAWTGTQQAVSRRPYCAVALRRTAWSEHGMGPAWKVWIRHGHTVNQMGKTHSKPSAAQHGRGTAWARHAMCESAFIILYCKPEGKRVCTEW
jgi:hypothetical protein